MESWNTKKEKKDYAIIQRNTEKKISDQTISFRAVKPQSPLLYLTIKTFQFLRKFGALKKNAINN